MPVGKKALDRITSQLKRYQRILKAAKDRDVSESDTAVIIGDILADVLGYEKYVEITTEFAIKGTYVDLAVKVGRDVHFLVEAKAIGVPLKEIHVKQAVDYGANHGVEWVILSNGVVWQVYRIEFKQPISKTLVAEIDLLNSSQGSAACRVLWQSQQGRFCQGRDVGFLRPATSDKQILDRCGSVGGADDQPVAARVETAVPRCEG